MDRNYTHKQKLAYYKQRANDSTLTPAQRKFAKGFITGAEDTFYAYTYNMPKDDKTLQFLKSEIPIMEKGNKKFVNATYNGYGQGTVSTLKDMVENWIKNDMDKTYYLIYVVGERGVGKTTLLAHFATQYMIPPYSVRDLYICRKEIERLRLGGWDNLSLEPHIKHLVYVVDDTFIARGLGYKPRISMELQFEKIGLYDGKNEVSYLLPYAKVFMPEVQSKLDSRKWERTAEYFLRYLELKERSVFRCGRTLKSTTARTSGFAPLRIS